MAVAILAGAQPLTRGDNRGEESRGGVKDLPDTYYTRY